MTDFPNIDFSFRRGYNESAKTAPFKEGSLNFVKDTGEFFVDKDGLRFNITSIIFDAGSEAQIRAIVNPQRKLYLSNDTFKLMYFDRINLEWKYVGSDYPTNALLADRAISDEMGNNIYSYYYSKQDATAEHTNIVKEIDSLKSSVGSIIRFDVEVLDSIINLPEEGEKGIIYCVPISDYIDMYETATMAEDGESSAEVMDNYVELLWISDSIYGGYYEVVGTTHVNMNDYFKKEEVLNLIESLRQEFTNIVSLEMSDVINSVNTIRSTVNSIQSSLTTRMNGIVNTLNSVSGRVSDNGTAITNLQNNDVELEKDISANVSSINTLRQDITLLANTVSQIQKEVSNNAIAIESAVAVNESQSNKIVTIEGDITENTKDISTNAGDIVELQKDVQQLKTDTSGNTTEIEGLQQSIQTTIDQSLVDINQNISGMEEDIAKNASDIRTINGEITELQQGISVNASGLQSLRTDLNTTNQEIDDVADDVATNASGISTLSTTVTNLGKSVTNATNQIGNVTDSVTTLTNAVNKNKTDITDLDQTKLESDLGEEV